MFEHEWGSTTEESDIARATTDGGGGAIGTQPCISGSSALTDSYIRYARCPGDGAHADQIMQEGIDYGGPSKGSYYPFTLMYGVYKQYSECAMDMTLLSGIYNCPSSFKDALRSCTVPNTVWSWGGANGGDRHSSALEFAKTLYASVKSLPLTLCIRPALGEMHEVDYPDTSVAKMDGVIGDMLNQCVVNLMMEPLATPSDIVKQRFTGSLITPGFLCCNYTPHSLDAGTM
jgi:hypothetical protein